MSDQAGPSGTRKTGGPSLPGQGEKPQYMTVGQGSSEHAARLTGMINDDYDSGYGGSNHGDHSQLSAWDPSLADIPINKTGNMQDASPEAERHAVASHVHQMFYNQNRTALGRAITQTVDILKRLQAFNAKWPAHYPTVRRDTSPSPSRSDPRPGLHHTQSTLDTLRNPTTATARPMGLKRAETSLSIDSSSSESDQVPKQAEAPRLVTPQIAQQFSVLKIELRMQGVSQTDLVHSLEKQSIAALLDGQINNSIRHLFSLRERIEDTSSKVLVTGDLNAGKSTFCNALLRRKVLPEDQQPCTSIFCEVLDVRENSGIEEVHAIPIGATYSRNDESTYHVYALNQLDKIVVDHDRYSQCKIYIKDIRSVDQSLLNNGVVDIALIDAPGLNNDSIKTTAVFARQEEIDVVVFVVSAANHFTQSAKEFIFNAAREKAYMFMVVNGFDNIKDKQRCQEMILRQTAQLSPATFKESSELVHFVSSNAIPVLPPGGHPAQNGGSSSSGAPSGDDGNDHDDNAANDKGKGKEQDKIDDFVELEASLRRFVLEKRARSKLAPARTYLANVLQDMLSLADVNKDVAQREYERISKELQDLEPVYKQSQSATATAGDGAQNTIEDAVAETYNATRTDLTSCIEKIGSSDLGVEYPGLLGVYDYAETIKSAMLHQIASAVTQNEDRARERTAHGANAIKNLGILHLGDKYVDLTFSGHKMFRLRRDVLSRQVHVNVEVWDLVDVTSLWERQEKVAGTSMAVTVAGVLGSRMLGGFGWLDGTLGVAKVVGSQNLRRIVLPSILLAGKSRMQLVLLCSRLTSHSCSRNLICTQLNSTLPSSTTLDQGCSPAQVNGLHPFQRIAYIDRGPARTEDACRHALARLAEEHGTAAART